MYIDTHSHLYLPEFEKDIEEVVEKALNNDVKKILLPNIDVESIPQLKNLRTQYPEIFYTMMGIHPTSVKNDFLSQLKIIEQELSNGNYIAIGEIGIDLYWDKTHYKSQVEAFEYQIDLALKNNLPIVVHARNSFVEIFQILANYKTTNLQGVMHSFTGTMSDAEKAIKHGFYLGVGGISTFKNSPIGKIISSQPLERLILETDSPYLAPTPKRGKRNESSFIPYIAEKLAQNMNLPVEEVKKKTTANAKKLFKL